MESEPDDKTVIGRYLAATKHLSQQDAAGIIGVSQRTISAWKRGDMPEQMSKARKRKLLECLERAKDGRIEPEEWSKANGERPSDLARQIDEVLHGEGEPWEKRYLIAEIAAAYRSSGYAFDADGARYRSRAMDRAERRALLRDQREWRRTFQHGDPLERPADEGTKKKKTGVA